jgi:hypothetical protein
MGFVRVFVLNYLSRIMVWGTPSLYVARQLHLLSPFHAAIIIEIVVLQALEMSVLLIVAVVREMRLRRKSTRKLILLVPILIIVMMVLLMTYLIMVDVVTLLLVLRLHSSTISLMVLSTIHQNLASMVPILIVQIVILTHCGGGGRSSWGRSIVAERSAITTRRRGSIEIAVLVVLAVVRERSCPSLIEAECTICHLTGSAGWWRQGPIS